MAKKNNHISKKTAQSVLTALFSPSDLKKFQYFQAVFVCGLPGSGKTTVARLLNTCYGFQKLSTDQIRLQEPGQRHRSSDKGHDYVMAVRYMVYEKLGRLAAKALSQGKRIVIDGTNLDDKRYGLIGNVLTQIPVDRVAFIIIRPPEWIMRKRLEDKGKEAVKEWWTIYKHWRTYVKQGVAVFPTSKNMPRINQIAIRRYSLKTFDWVPDIKAIMWDVDGTLYDSKVFTDHWNKQHIRRYSKARNLSFKKAEKEFWDKYVQLGSRTKVLEAAGINAKKHMDTMAMETDYSKVLGSNRKLHHLFDSLKHVRHYIFSNASRKATLKKLSGMKLDKGIFEDIFTTYEINQLTKDANSYDQVVKKTKLKPENILMVGDREEHDILPAKRVGMRTCYVWGVSKEADVSLPNVYEVAELFGVEV